MKNMKLKVIDYFWAVGKKTRRRGSYKIPVAEGQSTEISHLTFKIEKVETDQITVALIRWDGEKIKEITVEKGKGAYYHPFSMDGGHRYDLKLTRFF